MPEEKLEVFQAIIFDTVTGRPASSLTALGTTAWISITHLLDKIINIEDNPNKQKLLEAIKSGELIIAVAYAGELFNEPNKNLGQLEDFITMNPQVISLNPSGATGKEIEEIKNKFGDIFQIVEEGEWDGDELDESDEQKNLPADVEDFLKFIQRKPKGGLM